MKNIKALYCLTSYNSLSKCILNIDKPLNVNSIEIIKKIKEKFNKLRIFSSLIFNKGVSGCLVCFFQNSKNNLTSFVKGEYKIISVIKLNTKIVNQTNFTLKYFKKNFYQSNRSYLNKNQIKFVNIKISFVKNVILKPRKIICILKSKNKILLGSLDLTLSLILRKNCHFNEARKINIGILTENDNLIIFQDFTDLVWTLNFWKTCMRLPSLLLPVQFVLKTLKRIVVKNSVVNSLCYGSNLAINGISAIEENIQKAEYVLILTQRKEIIAIGEITFNSKIMLKCSKGNIVILRNIIMNKNFYPKKWKWGSRTSLQKLSNSLKTHFF